MSQEDLDSLQRQLKDARENLRLIQEREAAFPLSTDIPLHFIKEERHLHEKIAEWEHKIAELQQGIAERTIEALERQLADQRGKIRSTNLGRIAGAIIVAAVVAVAGYAGYLIAEVNAPRTAPEVDKGLSIESMSAEVYQYSKYDDPKAGKGWGRLSVIYDEASHTSYKFDYSLPDVGDEYVGLAFTFSKSQDLADYKFIEMTMNFKDEETYCRLFIKDITGQIKDSVPLSVKATLSDDIAVSANGGERTLKIPLDTNFQQLNRKVVKEVEIDCDTNATRGNHTFTVDGIRFLKS